MRDIYAVGTSDSSIFVEVTPPTNVAGIETYVVYAGKPNSTHNCVIAVNAMLECTITGLQEFTTYVVGARSCNPTECSAEVEKLATTLPRRKLPFLFDKRDVSLEYHQYASVG